jgi:cytidine deaminase
MADARLDALVEAARAARTRAYAPYSEFAVGAAALGGDRIFTGGNVENASFPVSVCAERNAVAAMLDGGQQRLDAVAIVTDAAAPAPPCGACRQVLWEFGPNALVVSETLGGERLVWALEDLFPAPFERGPR